MVGQMDGSVNRPASSNSLLPPDLMMSETSSYLGSSLLMNHQSKSSLASNDEQPSLAPVSFNSNFSTPSGLFSEDTSSSSRGTKYYSIAMAAEQDILQEGDESDFSDNEEDTEGDLPRLVPLGLETNVPAPPSFDENDSDIEDSSRPPADQRKSLQKATRTPNIDSFLDALDTRSQQSPGSRRKQAPSARSVRSTGSGSKRRGRRNQANGSSSVQDPGMFTFHPKQHPAKSGSVASASAATSFSNLSSTQDTLSFTASLSRTSEGSPMDSNRSSATSSRAVSAPIAWKRKARKPQLNADATDDDLSQKMSASFSSFGRWDGFTHRNNFGRPAFHESFNYPIENSPSSERSTISRAHSMCGTHPSRKVPIVLGTRNDDGELSAFQVDGKEASIIEGLLETTKETSPTKRKEAMMKWLQITAAEIMSPTQHSSINDSSRLSQRASIAQAVPSPDVYSPKTTSSKHIHGGNEPSQKQNSGEELSKISEHDELVKACSSHTDEHDAVEDSARILDRSMSKRESADSTETRTRSARKGAQPARSRSNSNGSKRRVKSVDRESQRNQSPRKQKAGTKASLAIRGEKEVHSRVLQASPESIKKAFIDKFLDHDVETADDSISRVVISPGGTAKTRTKDDVKQYKASLLGDSPIEDSINKLRIEPDWVSPSKRTILQDPIPRRDEMRKMKSVPNLRVPSDKLVELFVAEAKPLPAPPSSATPKTPKKKKSKKSAKGGKDAKATAKKKKKRAATVKQVDKSLTSLDDLPRQSPTRIQDKRALMASHFQKSKSMSHLDQRSLHTVDKQLLVQRLQSLTPELTTRKTLQKQAAPTRHEKASSVQKKKTSKSTSPAKRPKKEPTAEQKQKCKSEVVEKVSAKPRSMKFADTGRPFCLSGDRWKQGVTRSKSMNPMQSKNKQNEDFHDEIVELASPPLQPRRKASRDPSLNEWKTASKSTPNLLAPGQRSGEVKHFKSVRNVIGEGSILEIPDDSTICSELTDAHSDYYENLESSKKKKTKKKKKLKAINEAKTSFEEAETSISDSLTKDKTLHLSRRWDNPRRSTDKASAPQTPKRSTGSIGKDKLGWIKRKLNFVKPKYTAHHADDKP